MQVFHTLAEVPPDFGPSVVTIGNFDGAHRGHQRILTTVVERATQTGAEAVVVTFEPHPGQVHRPEAAPAQIMSLAQKLEEFNQAGITAVLVINYTLEFAQLSPEDFVQTFLIAALKAKTVVIGHDIHFGQGNSGNLATMQRLGNEYAFEVDVVPDLGMGSERRVSSTGVREALERGEVADVARILGRPHRMRAEVVTGAARGRELGFPTANLALDAEGLPPADGVYAGWLIDGHGQRWPAAISVGNNPTFAGVGRQVEAHVVNRPQEPVENFDLYGQIICLEFVERLRGMVAYTGVEALITQMRQDVTRVKEILK